MAEGLPGKDVPIYPIGSVERLTGLTARQIRYYETKKLVEPARTRGNQRLYTPRQVERLVSIRKLMAEGYSLRSIAELLAEEDRQASLDRIEDYPATERMARHGLRSLYPVSDAARLQRLIDRRGGEEPGEG